MEYTKSQVPGNMVEGGARAAAQQESTRLLNGWKEIAQSLGRGVRTVQRWEKLGLPVRRPNAHLRSAVVARVSEIEAWLNRCGSGRIAGDSITETPEALELELLRCENERLRKEVAELRLMMVRAQAEPPLKPHSQRAA